MARRGNGEGTICQRKDGRWCAAAYALTPGGGEKRVYVYGRTARKHATSSLSYRRSAAGTSQLCTGH